MRRISTTFSLLFFALMTGALLPSCKEFEGEQTVPSYIRIDSIGLNCDYYIYGANTSKFTDAQVYVDGQIQYGGQVELPAVLPILKSGNHDISVRACIEVNGIKGTKPDYPFVNTVEFNDVNLVPDSVITLYPVTTYLPNGENLHVRWLEDFDGGAVSLVRTSGSDTSLMRVSGPLAWHDKDGIYSTYSGKVVLTSDTMQFTVSSVEELSDVPSKGQECMLEMDYKCSDTLLMGIYFKERTGLTEYPILRLRPTGASGEEPEEWNKIYINIGPYLVDYEGYEYFKIYFASWALRNEGMQYFYFDNLKLMYRDR